MTDIQVLRNLVKKLQKQEAELIRELDSLPVGPSTEYRAEFIYDRLSTVSDERRIAESELATVLF